MSSPSYEQDEFTTLRACVKSSSPRFYLYPKIYVKMLLVLAKGCAPMYRYEWLDTR